ncbi:DDB1- and CUL4-associated factor homolog 1-like isoform X1 [Zingiber officinale]|uniref:DDB1- and CUL4-associated factor homolog 1-like isoform X1 n=1 Tax=Zingiber officinale TaxID=94328 RepID=UPI001C4CFEE9|nr:DDB1- and CUL4-associated factor homolog 1-like isoform X1 [Zingiber officinale]
MAEERAAAAAVAVAAAAADTPAEAPKVDGKEDEAILARAQKLISKIVETQVNPNPRHLHALATILEAQESRYLEETANSPFNNIRSSHNIGRLGNLVQESDEFYDLISTKFLTESVYSLSIRAAAARLLISCSSCWMYPHVFEDAVLDNVKSWVIMDMVVSDDNCIWKRELGEDKPTDSEMLRTYSTGLLALSLASSSQVVEDMLTSELSTKLMRYLRTRHFGDSNSCTAETNHPSSSSSIRARDEARGRSRLGSSRIGDRKLSANPDTDRDDVIKQGQGDHSWGDGSESQKSVLTDSSSELVSANNLIEESPGATADGRQKINSGPINSKSECSPGSSALCVDADDKGVNGTCIVNHGLPKSEVNARITEVTPENENSPSPSCGAHLEGISRPSRERNFSQQDDNGNVVIAKDNSDMLDCNDSIIEEDNDERLQDCIVGKRDISNMVKKALRAAEAEARTANAPIEAIKAAGDAAAELVKTAAIEAWKNTNDEEAAVLAASQAASTVVEAALTTEISRNASRVTNEIMEKPLEAKEEVDRENFTIWETEHLARLRDKYSIQCLEYLGEYVEALGPILHEKGVDVCLALLQRSCRDREASSELLLLPEVLKLICALAAHRKFAALFVDRGGIQKLLSVRRDIHTFFGLSSCLFTIGSLQAIMERVCALPSAVVHQVVELALQLLECAQDLARKNAAIFFAAAFVFRAILDSFDSQEGLQKMLNILHTASSVRSGGNSGALGVPNASARNDRSPGEVLTSSEKQIAYHTCVALRQYFRAHLILLVDSLRPNKSSRGIARSNSNARAAYKPLDISNEAMDSVFLQIQRDRKLGPTFVRTRWAVVDKFLAFNGHITMLELCLAPSVDRYLHDLAQYALGVLHIVTLVKDSRKLIINASLNNNRVGMSVILDAANGVGYVDPEVIHPALNVLVNLVCPPPSISNKPSVAAQGQQPVSAQTWNGPSENREKHYERNNSDNVAAFAVQNETRERNAEPGSSSNTPAPSMSAGVVGDRRISLGSGYGSAGLAAQLEQGYHQAREAVRANNGIKILLHLLNPRMITPAAALDCIRALACRVLLGLARDESIAHILTNLQVGKKLSELIRDLSSQVSGTGQSRWQSELIQVSVELIAIVTNSGRASTLAATDAAAPTLRRFERAAIAAATPITYHSRELLLLIHEHLLASGLTATAALLQKEADLTPLPSLGAPAPPLHQTNIQETMSVQFLWPSGRAPGGFLVDFTKIASQDDESCLKSNLAFSSLKRKQSRYASKSSHGKGQLSSHASSNARASSLSKATALCSGAETPSVSFPKATSETEVPLRTPICLPMKRKHLELKNSSDATPAKRLAIMDPSSQSPLFQTPYSCRKNFLPMDTGSLSPFVYQSPGEPFSRTSFNNIIGDTPDDIRCQITPGMPLTSIPQPGLLGNSQLGNTERMTLDSLVVQYLKHQHRQCPAPITTLPPLPLLQPHICPEPSHSLRAPANVTARVSNREFRKQYGGVYAHRNDRQYIYSRYRHCRTCRDETTLLTSLTFLGDSSRIATGSHSGELKIFDSNSGNLLESQTCHQSSITLLQSALSGGNHLVLSSSFHDVKLWDASSILGDPLHTFASCKAARFSHLGTSFAALSSEASRREVFLYDVQTFTQELKLSDNRSFQSGTVRGHAQSLIHFSPMDTMLLWNGTLWDRRTSHAIHRFEQFTDYGGGGFHPAGNEVIINSEVWDLRKFKLLRTVPSLDQTVITFNGGGDVIYAILRRNVEEITSAINARRVRHPLFPAFRTIDAVNYLDIATVQVDRCVLDFATDPTDSFVGVIAMDDHEEMFSSARVYEVGRKRATDDDSDPDDGGESDEDEDENEESDDVDIDSIFEADLAGEGDSSDDLSNEDDEDGDSADDLDEDGDVNYDDLDDFEAAQGMLEIMAVGDEDADVDDDSEVLESLSSYEEGDFA